MTTALQNLVCPYSGEIRLRVHDGTEFASGVPACGCEGGLGQAVATSRTWQGCREDLTYFLDPDPAPSTSEMPANSDYHDAFRAGLDMIQNVCGVRFRAVDAINDANFAASFRRTGPGVLAFSDVGGQCGSRGNQVYGTQWDWRPGRFATVVAHEVGHLLGLGHDVCNSDGEYVVMCWQIQQDVTEVDQRTANFLRSVYGPPLDPPKPPVEDQFTIDGGIRKITISGPPALELHVSGQFAGDRYNVHVLRES